MTFSDSAEPPNCEIPIKKASVMLHSHSNLKIFPDELPPWTHPPQPRPPIFLELATPSESVMGAAWQRPTVGDFVLVSGHGDLSRSRRWGQLFADDGEQDQAWTA
jgi:hypothetical protein